MKCKHKKLPNMTTAMRTRVNAGVSVCIIMRHKLPGKT